MTTDEEALSAIYKKIEREKVFINGANAMRQQTQNEQVRSKLDTQMRESRRNIQFFEDKMRELQMRMMGQNMDNMRLGPGGSSGPSGQQGGGPMNDGDAPPTPPPKDARGNYIESGGGDRDYGSGDPAMFSQSSGGMMPPRHPFAPPPPGSGIPKPRANYSKLGLYPRIGFT